MSQVSGSENVTVTINPDGFAVTNASLGFHIQPRSGCSRTTAMTQGRTSIRFLERMGLDPMTSQIATLVISGSISTDAAGQVSVTFIDTIISLGVGSWATEHAGAQCSWAVTVVIHSSFDDGGTGL